VFIQLFLAAFTVNIAVVGVIKKSGVGSKVLAFRY
jgi:hypothetical protein